ncbi:MAG: MMPL family transporter [Gemmatales bacterium]|nr:MMPL family transporter [Gemmatales bacterium]MDW8222684.1 MMPL family transporter [Gemmatales bacterium]
MKHALDWLVGHPRWVLATWLIVAGLLSVSAWWLNPYLPPDTGDFLPEHSRTVQGYRLFREAFPDLAAESSIVLVFHSPVPLQDSDRPLVENLEVCLEQLRQHRPELEVGRYLTWLHPLMGSRLISADRQCALAVVHLNLPFIHDRATEAVHEIETLARRLLAQHQTQAGRTAPIELTVTGTAGFGRDLNVAVYHSLDITTWATVILVLALLVLVYRSIWVAVVPLVSIGAAVWVSLKLLEILCVVLNVPLVNIARIFVVVVLFGAGTDYCLFLLSRFREELQRHPADRAMAVALRQVGGALLASAAVVMVGLAMMGFAEFVRVSAVGPFVAVSLAVAWAAAISLAPACLLEIARWSQTATQQFPCEGRRNDTATSRVWQSVSRVVAARPGQVLFGSFLALTPLAWYGITSQAVMDVCAELRPEAESRRGLDLIRQHFPAGELGPLTVLLVAPPETSDHTLRQHLTTITQLLSQLENVQEIRSWNHPLGTSTRAATGAVLASSGTRWPQGLDWLASSLAAPYYVRRLPDKCITRLEVVMRTEPFSSASVATLSDIERVLEAFIHSQSTFKQVALHGITLFVSDLAQIHESDRWRVNSLVLLGILIILITVVRSFGWACYLLATVLFSYLVTLGVVSLLGPWWLGTTLGVTDWKVPYFLFVILVAVGEDYNIFLISRVREEQQRLGDYSGVQQALACTGATISMCGVIMAGAFATMMLSELATLFQLGLALSIGVLLETFVVRPILVPAALLAWYGIKTRIRCRAGHSSSNTSRTSSSPTAAAANAEPIRQSA